MFPSRISQFSASNSHGAMDFTVAWVPTGMNTGVSTGPCAVQSRPSRALEPESSRKISNVPISDMKRVTLRPPPALVEARKPPFLQNSQRIT